MQHYLSHGKLTAKDGERDKLKEILLQAAELVRPMPGCNVYAVSIEESDNQSVWVTEIWDSKDDHDTSLTNQEVRALISGAMPLIAEPPTQGQELTVVGGVL